jgi:hypothetical protein
MQLSGLVLDMYDDPGTISEIYPRPDELPEAVKTASALTPVEFDNLPDGVFALVLHDSGERFRKYACIDSGHTIVNVEYFLKHGHKLPEVAQKVAAKNLVKACGWYDLEPPEPLQKIALGLVQAANLAIMGPSLVKGTANQVSGNMAAVRAIENNGGGVVTPRDSDALLKGAEASGSHLMPQQPPGNLRAPTPRVAAVTSAVKSAASDLEPHVDVTGIDTSRVIEKRALRYAVGGKYWPLDSYTQVKLASEYFDERSREFSPEIRREYCANMVKRANELGIAVSDTARKYGSPTYAPEAEIKVACDMRRGYLEEKELAMLDSLLEKRASIDPEVFCEVLSGIDKLGQIDWLYGRQIIDPYYSTYGFEKRAENDVWIDGNDYVTKQQIEEFGATGHTTVTASYGQEFATEFQKDPWGVFSSLPVDQKRRFGRMATDTSPTGTQHVP